ncbi:helix-turn-helix domain-containing protein [Paenibacillus alvei]|uniref:helix-turn-helix domain-containing protein n=1 Tax=Paenibacillus alvei TaxID=44250 RepID=UPI00227DF1A9|nr:helix-turn-helix transcriptional regulator [Paenibacillus alvei]MCY9580274.1 helix-turn-helix domain-containing protein [Paenibacillus alvei]MCY9583400.1 helix-turn-helix domain-containing protein [Paenibacillus alvei]
MINSKGGGLILEVAVIKTIGELIQDTRRASNITLTQLSELSGIPKGTISRIENGEVKRPQFSTVHPLAKALNIPLETLIDYYVEIERRSDSLLHILHTTIQHKSNNELIQKVATKYLESCNEDSYNLTEKLYQNIDSIEDTSIKLLLYNLIIEHSRSHGMMPYIAKGMYQRYLIERNDFSKLKETYYSGKYILHYTDFLPQQDRIELYYKLGIHAFNLRLYYESIEYCRRVLTEDTSQSEYKIYALGILVDAHYSVEEYKEAEMYSMQYKQFDYLNYPHTKGNVVLMDALFVAKKGDTDKAIMLLKSFLETCDDIHVIPASKQLLHLYLQQNNLEGAKNVLEGITIKPSNLNTSNPLIFSRYADYLQIKGEYYLAVGNYEACIKHMVEGASYYSKVNNRVKEKLCRIIKTAFTHGDIL